METKNGLREKILVTHYIYGATERSRTADLLITNQLLYQLSYGGVSVGNGIFNRFLI